MIRKISNITDYSVIDQDVQDNISFIETVNFNDHELGAGGFGSVFEVLKINDTPIKGFVVKIFTQNSAKNHAYDAIALLHTKLQKIQYQAKTPTYHSLPELLGLPFIAFKGYDTISKEHCVGFVMYNLNSLGFEDYGDDTIRSSSFAILDLPKKLYLAYQLASTIDFLHENQFIHSDLSENSLWFNPNRVQLALIDFDSGYHFDSQEKPTTIGKIGHWIGKKFRNVIGQDRDKSSLTTLERIYEEYWVLANALFEAIFGVMPFFFLKDANNSTKSEYLDQFEWPHIDYTSHLFHKDNLESYQAVLSYMEQLNNAGAEKLVESFKTVFNKGFENDTKRISSSKWKELLYDLNRSVNNGPLISNFHSDKTQIKRKGESIKLSFNVEKYNTLFVNDKLVPHHQNEIALTIDDATEITLTATNNFEIVKESISISAKKVDPVIVDFKASEKIRSSTDPINLIWQVKNASHVTISAVHEKQKLSGNIEVEPTSKTSYVLKAHGFFDEIVTQELVVDIIKPKIKSFTWEINLNEGIDNIDLHWNTENCTKVEITPLISEFKPKGTVHVPIQKETTFKLKAIGLFDSDSAELIAHPFPVPIIEQLFCELPKIELNTKIDSKELEIPKSLFEVSNIELIQPISIESIKIDENNLKSSLESPGFVRNNDLSVDVNNRLSNFDSLYNKIIKKFNKRTG